VAQPTNFKYAPRRRFSAIGWITLAGAVLLVLGMLNVFYGISVLAGSKIFITDAAWLTGHTSPPGWPFLLIGLVQLIAIVPLLRGAEWGRWVGIASVAANMVAQLMFFSDFAAAAVALFGIDALAAYGLVTYGGGRGLTRDQVWW
jgi:hypothetical protein